MKKEIIHIMPLRLRSVMEKELEACQAAEEIRLRVGQPIQLRCADGDVFLDQQITVQDLEEMLTFISQYSVYAYAEEIRQGFVTITGGHRIGFAGQIRIEDGKIQHMVNIRFLNIRIAGEKKGCASCLLPRLFEKDRFLNTLLVSLPGIGKTTCLRDCIRQISNGTKERQGKKVCVLDERSEIAACHQGVPQNDLGIRTDVLDGCPKKLGMLMAVRSLSPEVIAVDELGDAQDVRALKQVLLSGCGVLGTIHGADPVGLLLKPEIKIMYENRLFQRYVFLKKKEDGSRIFSGYDQNMERLW